MKQGNKQFCYRYPHPAVTADCVIFGFTGTELKLLLVERGNEPYKGYWALPGGFMKMDETIDQAAARELREETNLSNVYLEQFRVYSDVERDPRERVVTVAFIALVRPADYNVVAGDDAANAMWFNERQLPPLAFDHREIIKQAREHLKETLHVKPIAFQLLNEVFSISELQRVYEVINETAYDRRNFQRSVLDANIVSETSHADMRRGGRNAKMYTVNMNRMVSEDAIDDDCVCESEELPMPAVNEYAGINSKCCSGKREVEKREGSTKGLFDFIRRK